MKRRLVHALALTALIACAPATGQAQSTKAPNSETPPAGAKVILTCVVSDTGGLKDCAVASEDPPGWGFGPAALGVATKLRVGKSFTPGETIKVPISFPPQNRGPDRIAPKNSD